MAETKIEVTEKEPEVQEVQTKESELQAEKAEEKAEQAEEKAEKAEQAAEQAKEESKKAEEAQARTEKLTSYNESVINGLKDSITLVVQRMEQVLGIAKESATMIEEINEELRTTLDLHQEQIGTLDEAASKIVTATAALVKLHKQMTTTQE